MSKDYENKNTSDGGNRCRRCDRPLIGMQAKKEYYYMRQLLGLE